MSNARFRCSIEPEPRGFMPSGYYLSTIIGQDEFAIFVEFTDTRDRTGIRSISCDLGAVLLRLERYLAMRAHIAVLSERVLLAIDRFQRFIGHGAFFVFVEPIPAAIYVLPATLHLSARSLRVIPSRLVALDLEPPECHGT